MGDAPVTTLALIARKPGLTREAFRAHYETTHAPLALPLMRGLLRYVRHHVRETLWGEVGFDVVTSFTYRDASVARDVIARIASPAGDAVLRDELRFMDKPRNRFFAVREVGELGGEDRSAPLLCIVFVKRAPDRDAGTFAARFASEGLSALEAGVHGLRWSLHREALATFGEPAWDAVVQLHATGATGLGAWCGALEREGARVAAVRVSEHETLLPAGGVV